VKHICRTRPYSIETVMDMSSHGGPPPKKSRVQYASFDEDKFVDSILDKKLKRTMCCGHSCLLKIEEESIRAHAMLLSFYFSLDPPDVRNRVYRSFVMSCYMLHVNKDGKHCQYRIPAVGHPLCRTTWLVFMNLSKSTYLRWCLFASPTRNVLPLAHALSFNSSNAAKPAARMAVRTFLRDIAESDGHPLPICHRSSDYKRLESSDNMESIVFLPPKYSKKSLHEEYNSIQIDSTLCITRFMFCNILETEFPFLRISSRQRGICDRCFVFRDLIRKTSDKNLDTHANEWKDHLVLAEKTRLIYRKSLSDARASEKYLLPVRLSSATVSYDLCQTIKRTSLKPTNNE